jgi:hypothetical protein
LLDSSQAETARARRLLEEVLVHFELDLKFQCLRLHAHEQRSLSSRIQGVFRQRSWFQKLQGACRCHAAAPWLPEKRMQQTNQCMERKALAKQCWVWLREIYGADSSISPPKGQRLLH